MSAKSLRAVFTKDDIRRDVLLLLAEEHTLTRGRHKRLEDIMALVERWGDLRYEEGRDEGFEQGRSQYEERP